MNVEKADSNIADKYSFLAEFAELKYESELRREDSIIQQASHMQTAFSFITAALFMAAPIVIEYRGCLSLTFFLVAFSSIAVALLLSLLFATIAQNRKKYATFPDINVMHDYMVKNEECFNDAEQRSKYLVDTYADVQKSKADINDNRVRWLKYSMRAFYVSLALCVIWFMVAICKIL